MRRNSLDLYFGASPIWIVGWCSSSDATGLDSSKRDEDLHFRFVSLEKNSFLASLLLPMHIEVPQLVYSK